MLGADHHGYVARLQALAEMLGHPRDSVEVLIYQLVHLTRGGEAAKMAKRRGDVVFLDEFVDEIGIDAARWYLLSRGHDQTIEIDIDLAAEKSQKNPVYYVQYAHARIAGVLRNAEGRSPEPQPSAPLAAEERDLVKRLLELPVVVREATDPPRPARDPDLRHPRRGRLPPLLPPPPRARVGGGGVPPRSLRRDARRRRDVPRPDRRRGARADVIDRLAETPARSIIARCAGSSRSERSTASWGFIAVLAAAVDLGAEALAFWRLALAARTLALGAVLVGRPGLLAPRGRLPPLALLGVVQGAHWLLFFEAVKHGSVALAVLTFYAAPLVLAVVGAARPPGAVERRRPRCGVRRRGRHRADRARQRRRVGVGVGRRRGPRLGGDLRGARRPLEAPSARRDAAPHGRVLGLLRRRARRRAGARCSPDSIVPDGAGEWGAVLALGVLLTGVSTLSTRCSCATCPLRPPGS